MKTKIKKVRRNSEEVRQLFDFYYRQKFFNKWMNKFKFPELNYQQQHYIMKKFWGDGTVSCLRPIGATNNLGIDMKEDSIIFTPYAPQSLYNIYDFPTMAMPINTRGVSFIPAKALMIDEEIVLGWCQKNHKSVFSSIEAKFNQLIDIEMTIRVSTKSQKMPWLFASTPENKQAMENLIEGLESDDPVLFTTLEESEKGKALLSGSPYVLDKLEQLRQKLEDDINTILGVNNVGIAEKKEHLIVDEVNANNQAVEESSDEYLEMLKDFFDRVDKVFGYKVNVQLAHEIENNEEMSYNEEGEKDDE